MGKGRRKQQHRGVGRKRRRGSHADLHPNLIALFPDLFVSLSAYDPLAADRLGLAVRALRERMGGTAREVAARLVEAHGPRIRQQLHHWKSERRKLPEVAALFPPLHEGLRRFRLDEAVALVRQRGARSAAAQLARRHGLLVFDELNTAATARPEVRELLGLRPLKPPRERAGRPKGATAPPRHDLEAYALTEIHDRFGVGRADLLRVLGRNPEYATARWGERSETADPKWFDRHLRRGRELSENASALAKSRASAVIMFLDGYVLDNPEKSPQEKLAVLTTLLVDAIRPGVRRARLVAAAVKALRSTAGRITSEEGVHTIRALLAEHLSKRLVRRLPPQRG